MRNLVIIIETILFLIITGWLILGIFTSTEIKDYIPLECGLIIFFIILVILSIFIAYLSIKKTIKLFDSNVSGIIKFIKQKIQQDKFIILLIFLAIIEFLITAIWAILGIIFFIMLLMFIVDDTSSSKTMFIDVLLLFAFVFIPYLIFLFLSYSSLSNILKALQSKYITKSNITLLTTITFAKLLLVFMVCSIGY